MDRMVWCCFNEAKKDNKWMLLRRKSCDWRLEIVIFFRFYVVSLRAPIICFHSGGLMKNCRRIHRTCSLWTVACTKSRNFQTTFLNIGFGICLFPAPSTYYPQMGKNLCPIVNLSTHKTCCSRLHHHYRRHHHYQWQHQRDHQWLSFSVLQLTMNYISLLNISIFAVFYNPLPLYHSAGGVVGVGLMICSGATLVIIIFSIITRQSKQCEFCIYLH